MSISSIKNVSAVPAIETQPKTVERSRPPQAELPGVSLAATPDAPQQTLTETFNSRQGIDTTTVGKGLIETTNSPEVASVTLLAANTTPAGGDKAPALRQNIVWQLQKEAIINTDPTYSADLNALAQNIRNGRFQLPAGTYTPVTIRNPRLATDLPNAVPSGRYSGTPQQARAQVQEFDREIARLDREIERWQGIANHWLTPAQAKLAAQANVARLNVDKARVTIDKTAFINDARLNGSRGADNTVNLALANPADAGKTPVIFINGFNTDVNRSGLQALELSDRFNSPVQHVANVSSIISFARAATGIITGTVREQGTGTDLNAVDQRIEQHLVGNRPAASTAANLILDQLLDPQLRKNNTPVKIVGYSQGAAIGAQAIRDVESYLGKLVDAKQISEKDKTQMLGRIRLLGVGAGAAERHIDKKFVDGRLEEIPALKNINYRIIYDRNDPITRLVGVGDEQVDFGDFRNRMQPAIDDLANGRILPHLSYFKSYEYTDPGSRYNPRAGQEFENWFSGRNIRGAVDIAR